MVMQIAIEALKEAMTFIGFVGGLGLLAYGLDKFIDWSQKFDLW